MNVGAADCDEAANLDQRLGGVVNAKIEDGVDPRTAACSSRSTIKIAAD